MPTKIVRQPSTPEQLAAALLIVDGKPTGDPCRWLYAVEVWPEGDGYHPHAKWALRVPVHAVIHGLRRDVDRYGELLGEQRAEIRALKTELDRLRSAVCLIENVQAAAGS